MNDDPHDDLLFLELHLNFLYTDYIGRRIYQCRCCERIYVIQSAQVSFTAMTMPTLTLLNASSPQPTPERTPVPAEFYKAFEGDETDLDAISFDCACGMPLTIKKYSPESTISGVFCQKCDMQHYINWRDGIVRHGKMGGEA